MNRVRSITALSALLVVCWLASGRSYAADPGPIATMHHQVMIQAAAFESDVSDSGRWRQAREDAELGRKVLANWIKPAVGEADGHPDLAVAVKAFYVAAKTYFDSADTFVPLPTFDATTLDLERAPEEIQLKDTQVKLKADLDAKANAMMLEAQLAGVTAS